MPEGSGLMNTEICFLPPNTTAKLQPLDRGIIAAFKVRYRKQWISYMIEQHEPGLDALSTVNILKAVQWCIRAWDEVAVTTFTNCWSHLRVNIEPNPAKPPFIDEAIKELQPTLAISNSSNGSAR